MYLLTHTIVISRPKCHPVNGSSIGSNRCISSSPATHPFAPEPTPRYLASRCNVALSASAREVGDPVKLIVSTPKING
jgi:hypothetical protein